MDINRRQFVSGAALLGVAVATGAALKHKPATGGVVTLPGAPRPIGAGAGESVIPVGYLTTYAGDNVPEGWVPCDGRYVDKKTYAELFAVIGDTYSYGAGDGVTFRLPDLVPPDVPDVPDAARVRHLIYAGKRHA